MNQIKKIRNGEIDIIKFLFAICIMIKHFSISFHKGIAIKGSIGVEFFFIVTGYFMACNANKQQDNPDLIITKETWNFILTKIKSFYPYYFLAVLIKLIAVNFIFSHKGLIKIFINIIKSIPTFTLTFYALNWEDLSGYYVGAWYLSAMILCLFMLYPLLLKYYTSMTEIIFPIISVFIIGYLWTTNNCTLALHSERIGPFYSGIYRGLGEIALGATLKPLVDRFNRFEVNKVQKIMLSTIKFFCFAVTFAYIGFGRKYACDLYILLLLYAGVLLSFSENTYKIKGTVFSTLLGKLSLTVYIFHGTILDVLKKVIKNRKQPYDKFFILVGLVFIACCILTLLTDLVLKGIKKIKIYKKSSSITA